MSMKQVPRDDFEILTKYHPGEVRYYVDTAIAIAKNRGAKVNVSRKPKAVVCGAKKPAVISYGKHVQLGIGTYVPKLGTKSYMVLHAAKAILENDPTKVMLRPELTQAVAVRLPQHDKKSVIVPALTLLIREGTLRYTGSSK